MSEFKKGDIVIVDHQGKKGVGVFDMDVGHGLADVMQAFPSIATRVRQKEDISWASENHDNVFDIIREQGLVAD